MDSIYKQALEHYGTDAQLDLLQEECGELIAAINHYRRGRCGWERVVEEMADVETVQRQLRSVEPLLYDSKIFAAENKLRRLIHD